MTYCHYYYIWDHVIPFIVFLSNPVCTGLDIFIITYNVLPKQKGLSAKYS